MDPSIELEELERVHLHSFLCSRQGLLKGFDPPIFLGVGSDQFSQWTITDPDLENPADRSLVQDFVCNVFEFDEMDDQLRKDNVHPE